MDESALPMGFETGFVGDSFILSDHIYKKQGAGRRASDRAGNSSSNKNIESASPNSKLNYKTAEPRKTMPINLGADIAS